MMHGDRSRPARRAPWAFTILACGVLACGAAAAGPVDEYLQRMDADHDGRASRSEYVAWLSQTFATLDTNHDGVLAGDELPPGARRVTLAEYRANLEAAFARQDRNHDGFLDARELARPPG